jgi:transposase-like protein
MRKSMIREGLKSSRSYEMLEGMVREKIQEFIQEILEEELTELLGCKKSERRKIIGWGGGIT